ncbi:MAG: hypothetical protein U1F83_10455 [Verrucomicrobiota bacterium]
MNNNPFDRRRPTSLEDKAYIATMRHFVNDLNQFAAGSDAVKQIECNLSATALSIRIAARQQQKRNPILADDGTRWHKCVDLLRPLPNSIEMQICMFIQLFCSFVTCAVRFDKP